MTDMRIIAGTRACLMNHLDRIEEPDGLDTAAIFEKLPLKGNDLRLHYLVDS